MLSVVYNGVDITHTVNGTLADWTSTKRLSFRKAARAWKASTEPQPLTEQAMSEVVQSPKQPLPHHALEVPGAYLVIAGSSVIDSSLALGSFRARAVRPLSLRILGGKHAMNNKSFSRQLIKPGSS